MSGMSVEEKGLNMRPETAIDSMLNPLQSSFAESLTPDTAVGDAAGGN